MDYVFVYGSLLCEVENQDPNNIIVCQLIGAQRGWWIHPEEPYGFHPCYLGLYKTQDTKDSVYGALIKIPHVQTLQLDCRENMYTRTRIDMTELIIEYGKPENDIAVYTYTIDEKKKPSEKYPIVQSYVDLCMTGCLFIDTHVLKNIDYSFTTRFLKNTNDWCRHWKNDRLFPRRAFVHLPNVNTIDRLIYTTLPLSIVSSITIE